MNLLKFITKVILIAIPVLSGFILSVILLPFSYKAACGALINLDRFIASVMFGTINRTISGVIGEAIVKKQDGYVNIAKMVDKLAILFGDEPDHCVRAYEVEKKVFKL